MASDSEPDDEGLDVEDDVDDEQDLDDEPDGGADDATEDGDGESPSEDSEDGSEDDGDDSSEPSGEIIMDLEPEPSMSASDMSSQPASQPSKGPLRLMYTCSAAPSPPPAPVSRKRSRSLSPAYVRRKGLFFTGPAPRTYTVEAICALPHPVPTHALASSACVTHLLTGSDDGYIRDYDIFTAVNGKNFLTAPQRHHAGVVEGIMKSGQIRFWWENLAPLNPAKLNGMGFGDEEPALSPVYSLAMHSDALWTLAGSDVGHISLFTTRHEPGRCIHVMTGHRGRPVAALAMDHDEKGFYSAGWDGDAIQWDLNIGDPVRNFTAHGAQLACVAVRPIYSAHAELSKPDVSSTSQMSSSTTLVDSNSSSAGSQPPPPPDSDAKSDASFDPLFDDDEEEPEGGAPALPKPVQGQFVGHPPDPRSAAPSAAPPRAIAPPKNAPPLLDAATSGAFSADVLMTASIDGQVILWDKRVYTPGTGVGRLWMSEKTPPWCLSIYAGRRNGTIDVWDTRQLGRSGPGSIPRLLKTLRNPASSGVVSCVVAFPDGKHIASASIDNLRLWNVAEAMEPDAFGKMKSGVQFKIIPGHHGGYISQMLVDPGARFLISASSNRGWHGDSTKTVFVHDIKHVS
ncbi:WD40-repeat-containing domain protein [Mycena rosella]|uniref:WD40-repeat-containing domain protein n=1 Tax=Mycena rosella TaxID=1033263 RepID=A0AAD7GHP2_MYCRO|nr:WD40-repeat-containing domain protein [Mycena rosella]